MVRTLISLDPEDKAWLDDNARETGRTMTAVVREAVSRYRSSQARRERTRNAKDFPPARYSFVTIPYRLP